MAVALDANATANTFGNAVTTIDNGNLTVGSGENRALVAQIAFLVNAPAGLTVVWDPAGANQSLSQIIAQPSGGDVSVQLWGLVAPVSGNKILRATWTGATRVLLNAVSWSGVNQTGGVTTFAHEASTSANSTSPSLVVTSATGNAVMDVVAAQWNALSAPTQTQTYLDNAGAYELLGCGSRAAGAATVTFGWTLTPGGDWASVVVDIVAAAEIGGIPGVPGAFGTEQSAYDRYLLEDGSGVYLLEQQFDLNVAKVPSLGPILAQ